MRNFLCLATNVDVTPLLTQIYAHSKLWNQYKVRTAHERSVHRVVDDILLRYSRYSAGDDFISSVCCDINPVTYPAWHVLTAAQSIVFAIMARVQGVHLGRVLISRVPPGVAISQHSDRIAEAEALFPDAPRPAVYYERYHVPLVVAPGVVFRCGGEECTMRPGEVWWFNNEIPHEVINNSSLDRLHLIVDIRVKTDDYVP